MEDEFIEDDFLEESEGSANNRPFLIIVGALVTVFILAAACTLILLTVRGRAESTSAEAMAIETQNAITIVTNTAVAQFIAQTETAQALPTNTPEIPPTSTRTPAPASSTPPPTETPVIDAAAGEGAGAAGEEGDTETGGGEDAGEGVTGTIIIGGEAGTGTDSGVTVSDTTDSAGTGSVILGGTATPITATGGTASALPQTGLETWVIALIGLLLIGVLVAAHRLRTH